MQTWLCSDGARDEAYDIPYSTVHVGQLAGGTALNIVPDRAELVFEYRHLAEDPATRILSAIHEAAETACRRYRAAWPDARIEIAQDNAYPGLNVAPDAPVIRTALSLARSNVTTKVAFGTEAGVFDGLGIPTIVCGPGSMEGQGHKPDEFLQMSQLRACEQMMDRIVDALV